MEMPEHAYVYRARPERVIDGDTICLVIDAGFGLWVAGGHGGARVRLLGVDTPERNEPGWDAARAFTSAWLFATGGNEWPLVIQTVKADNFGRYLGDIWRVTDGRHLNRDLIEAGHARVRGG